MTELSTSATPKVRLLIIFAVAAAFGCSGEEVVSMSEQSQALSSQSEGGGALVAQYRQGARQNDAQFSVTGHFIRARGIDTREALRALDVWQPRQELALDSCQFYGGLSVRDKHNGKTRLEFLDVGNIEVRGPDRRTYLRPRLLPMLPGEFSGVIYETESSQNRALDYEPGGTYRFSAPGPPGKDGFDVSMTAPAPVELAVSRSRSDRGDRAPSGTEQPGFEVEWSERATDSHRFGESVFLKLSSNQRPSSRRLRCRLEDDGRFAMPEGLLEQFRTETASSEPAEEERYFVTLRRVRAETARVEGVGVSHFVLSAIEKAVIEHRSD